jgi:integrase
MQSSQSIRESGRTEVYDVAKKLLRQRLHEIDKHEFVQQQAKPARVEDLYETMKLDREANGKGRKADLPGRWKHLEPTFGRMLANEVTTDDIRRYIAARKKDEAANATVNRELATLKRMFRLATQSTPPRVQRVPYFPMLDESKNVRKGFVEDSDFDKLTAEAKEPWLRAFLECAFTFGWRRGELLGLRVRNLNFKARTIRLDAGTTKNGEGREVLMTERVFELLRAVTTGKNVDDAVFTRRRKKGGEKPVTDIRKAWMKLTARAGLSGLLVHDLRRSGAKALRAAGVPESVVMSIGGWRTQAMFRRYAIVSAADQKQAVEMLELARAARAKASAPISAPTPQTVTDTVQ